MWIITSHINLDFDGLASMVAAEKLYPKAKILLPDRISLSVQQFLGLYKDAIPFIAPQQIDFENIETVILVDTPNLDRVGEIKDFIKESEFIIYDHHPAGKDNINVTYQRIENVGAAVTILIEELIKKRITISPFEATIMALGIYTDTGSFSYNHTTSRDLNAAAYLLEQGANLSIITKFLERPLLGEQQELFNSLMKNTEEYNLKGLHILIAWHHSEKYLGGLAVLARKILEITGVDVLILVVKMGKKVYVVGRSNTDLFDMSILASRLGGGGHRKAASAVIKSEEYKEVLRLVRQTLSFSIKPSKKAKDIMSKPVKTIEPSVKIEEVAKIMLRYGHSGLPVLENDKLVGIISRAEVDKAFHHGLGHAPVKGFMSKNVHYIPPEISVEEIQNIMINNDIGRLPVLDNGHIVGIVTRTDVLNFLHGEKIKTEDQDLIIKSPFKKDMKLLIEKNFSAEVLNIIKFIGAEADKKNYGVFIVGGVVRDLLLGYPNEDIDIVIEGEGIAFAKKVAEKFSAHLVSHDRFGTATCRFNSGLKIDISTARREYYDYPAALPKIERSSLREDLFRRDFTINAMAIQLNADKYGCLVDYFYGYRDLQHGKIKILYNLSFIEDPTRILRAVRFEQRLNFKMDEHTFGLAVNSVDLIKSVSEKRIATELKMLFTETKPFDSITRLQKIGIWDNIVRYNTQDDNKIDEIKTLTKAYEKINLLHKTKDIWICFLLVFIYKNPNWQQRALKYALNKSEKKIINETIILQRESFADILKEKQISLGIIHKHFKNFSKAAIIFYILKEANNEFDIILNYLSQRDLLEIPVTGIDLKNLGIPPGQVYAKIFENLELAMLDGEIKNKKEALDWVRFFYNNV